MSKTTAIPPHIWQRLRQRAGGDPTRLLEHVWTFEEGWQAAMEAVTKEAQRLVSIPMPKPPENRDD